MTRSSAYVNIDTEEMIKRIDSLVIGFQTKDNNKATFVVPPLKPGWNLLSLPKKDFKQNQFDWGQVEETSVELTAKKGRLRKSRSTAYGRKNL